jgi:glycosyltransferase involved in cell wall biosynthesis
MRASVIIPSYNSRTTIGRCLEALRNQRTEFEHEVIVVDSSDDGTGEIVASQFPEIRLVRLPERTLPGPARNLAIEQARSDLLVFTDADCAPEPQWLQRMILAQAGTSSVAVGGAVLNGLPKNPVAWSGYLLEFSEKLPAYPRGYVDLLPTCNVSFKREAFERHGLFPVDLWPSEDHIFSWRLVQAGERLLFDPTIRVDHIFRPRMTAFLRHQVRLGEASAAARRQVDLPHAWLVDSPLRWLTPAMRCMSIEARLARRDPANLLRFNLLAPLCAAGLVAWGIGFCRDGKGRGEGPRGA